jgi:hypothetical protein
VGVKVVKLNLELFAKLICLVCHKGLFLTESVAHQLAIFLKERVWIYSPVIILINQEGGTFVFEFLGVFERGVVEFYLFIDPLKEVWVICGGHDY